MFVCLNVTTGIKTLIPFHGINVDSSLTVYDVFQKLADGDFGKFS